MCLMENARSHQRDPSGESRDMPDYSSVSFTMAAITASKSEKQYATVIFFVFQSWFSWVTYIKLEPLGKKSPAITMDLF